MSIILALTYIVLPDNFIMNLFIYFYLIFILVDNILTDTAKILTWGSQRDVAILADQ